MIRLPIRRPRADYRLGNSATALPSWHPVFRPGRGQDDISAPKTGKCTVYATFPRIGDTGVSHRSELPFALIWGTRPWIW